MGQLRTVLALAAGAAMSWATQAAEVSSRPSAQNWEMKGLRLGMSAAEAKGLIPAAKCDSPAPGIERCSDDTQTFAGAKAKLAARFLDGTLIYVAARYLSFEQADAATAGLTEKYGPAARTFDSRKYVKAQDRMLTRTNYVWIDGDVALIVTPFDGYNPKTEQRYSAVSLLYKNLYDTVWLPRLRGGPTVSTSDL